MSITALGGSLGFSAGSVQQKVGDPAGQANPPTSSQESSTPSSQPSDVLELNFDASEQSSSTYSRPASAKTSTESQSGNSEEASDARPTSDSRPPNAARDAAESEASETETSDETSATSGKKPVWMSDKHWQAIQKSPDTKPSDMSAEDWASYRKSIGKSTGFSDSSTASASTRETSSRTNGVSSLYQQWNANNGVGSQLNIVT